MKVQKFILFSILSFSVIILLSNSTQAQSCVTLADSKPCNGKVNFTELIVHVGNWYKCSSCVPDLDKALMSFFDLPFCGDYSCSLSSENCTTCPNDCGDCLPESLGLEHGLVSYWKFDSEVSEGVNNMTPDEKGQYNGTLLGEAEIIYDVDRGYVLDLDGNGDYIQFPTDSYNFDHPFTISVWVKPSKITDSAKVLFGKGYIYNNANREHYSLFMSYSKFRFMVSNGDTDHFAVYTPQDGSVWYHLVGVYNGSMIFLYLNGDMKSSTSAIGMKKTSGRITAIGADAKRPAYYWNGTLDDLMVYNRSLSSEEVDALYADQFTKCDKDEDNDGHGGPGSDFSFCNSNKVDCDDESDIIYPNNQNNYCDCDDSDGSGTGIAEICDDLDNDCDGIVDGRAADSDCPITFPYCSGGECSKDMGIAYYVDSDATGSNDGSSWENAWSTISAINWSEIMPGDTIWLSGGNINENKIYYDELVIGKSGENNTPIFIRAGAAHPTQSLGHEGLVIINEGIDINEKSYVVINGKDATDELPDSPFNNTDFIKIRVSNDDICLRGTSDSMGIKLLYIHFFECGNANGDHGISISESGDTEVGYCDVEEAYQDGLRTGDFLNSNVVIHHTWIHGMGDDGIAGEGGFTIHDSVIGPWTTTKAPGHMDGMQIYSGKLNIYNNLFISGDLPPEAAPNAHLFLDYAFGGDHNYDHVKVYNNVFYTYGSSYDKSNFYSIFIASQYEGDKPFNTGLDHYINSMTYTETGHIVDVNLPGHGRETGDWIRMFEIQETNLSALSYKRFEVTKIDNDNFRLIIPEPEDIFDSSIPYVWNDGVSSGRMKYGVTTTHVDGNTVVYGQDIGTGYTDSNMENYSVYLYSSATLVPGPYFNGHKVVSVDSNNQITLEGNVGEGENSVFFYAYYLPDINWNYNDIYDMQIHHNTITEGYSAVRSESRLQGKYIGRKAYWTNFTFTNNIVYNTKRTGSNTAVHFSDVDHDNSDILIDYNIVHEGESGSYGIMGAGEVGLNNYRIDPQFVKFAGGKGPGNNFNLMPTSPARNQGAEIPWITFDKDGKPRPMGSAPDIGAYEFEE